MPSPVNPAPILCRTSQTLGGVDPIDEEKTITNNSDQPGKQRLANVDVAPGSESIRKESVEGSEDDDFPDGGLRAWLVVLGVSRSFLIA